MKPTNVWVATILALLTASSNVISSGESSMPLVLREGTYKPILTPGEIQLRMGEPRSPGCVLEKMVVLWKGKSTIYHSNMLPKLLRPALTEVSLLAATGSENKQLILVIPFNFRRGEEDANPLEDFDFARFSFVEGKLALCQVAEFVQGGHKGRWKISHFEYKPFMELVDKVTYLEAKANPYADEHHFRNFRSR